MTEYRRNLIFILNHFYAKIDDFENDKHVKVNDLLDFFNSYYELQGYDIYNKRELMIDLGTLKKQNQLHYSNDIIFNIKENTKNMRKIFKKQMKAKIWSELLNNINKTKNT